MARSFQLILIVALAFYSAGCGVFKFEYPGSGDDKAKVDQDKKKQDEAAAASQLKVPTFEEIIKSTTAKMTYADLEPSYSVGAYVEFGKKQAFTPIGVLPFRNYTVNPGLPEGLELDPDTGVISGYPKHAAEKKSYNITAKISSARAAGTIEFEVKDDGGGKRIFHYKPRQITAVVGGTIRPLKPVYPQTTDITFKAVGTLPEGLILNSTTGEISGTVAKTSNLTELTIQLETQEDVLEAKVPFSILNAESIFLDTKDRICISLGDGSTKCINGEEASFEYEKHLPKKNHSRSLSHECFIVAQGSAVECKGDNHFGALGDGTEQSSVKPVAVKGLNGKAKEIGVGNGYSCVLTTSNEVYCWGHNNRGQLGSESTNFCKPNSRKKTCSLLPVKVQLPSTVTSLVVTPEYACAVADKTPYCWGGAHSRKPQVGGPWN